MELFDSELLGELGDLNRANMDAGCRVLRTAEGTGGFGDDPAAPAVVIDGLRCRVVPAGLTGAAERVQQGTEVTVAPFLIYIDGAHPVREQDTISVAYDADTVNAGVTESFSVVQADDPVSFQVQTVVRCTRAR